MELAAQGLAQGLAQQIVSGIGSGAVFASLALALVLIYRAMAVANFAQGEIAMFGTFIAYALISGDFGVLGSKLTFLSSMHLNFWLVFVVTVAVSFLLGVLIERILIRPFPGPPSPPLVIVPPRRLTLSHPPAP